MGAVYLAGRADSEFRHEVALKIIKRGMDTDAIVRRFRTERQILADFKHPNIARLLDGGTTSDGVPYRVMEYVQGQPITAYCDERRLGIPDRLAIFRKICAAVAYAHQNLVCTATSSPPTSSSPARANQLLTSASRILGSESKIRDILSHPMDDPGLRRRSSCVRPRHNGRDVRIESFYGSYAAAVPSASSNREAPNCCALSARKSRRSPAPSGAGMRSMASARCEARARSGCSRCCAAISTTSP